MRFPGVLLTRDLAVDLARRVVCACPEAREAARPTTS